MGVPSTFGRHYWAKLGAVFFSITIVALNVLETVKYFPLRQILQEFLAYKKEVCVKLTLQGKGNKSKEMLLIAKYL